jgi:hypothetical protein
LFVSCGEEALDHVQPARARWREVQMEPRMFLQPRRDVGVCVRGVVVEDEMDLQALGDGSVDRAQERQKLAVAVAREALPDHRSGQDVERGEQRGGAVSLVVVGHRPGPAGLHRQ